MSADTNLLVAILVVLSVISILVGIYLYKWSETRDIVLPYRLFEHPLIGADDNTIVFRREAISVHAHNPEHE